MKRRKHIFLWTVPIAFAVRSQSKTSGNYRVTNCVMIFMWAVDAKKICRVVVERRSWPNNHKIKNFYLSVDVAQMRNACFFRRCPKMCVNP